MHSATLRKYGGSVVVAIPPALLQVLSLAPGSVIGMTVDAGRLVLEKRAKPRYTLDELMNLCDLTATPDGQEQDWFDAPPVGREVI